MKNSNAKFEDFESQKMSKNQQKTIQGGEPVDPSKGTGKGNG